MQASTKLVSRRALRRAPVPSSRSAEIASAPEPTLSVVNDGARLLRARGVYLGFGALAFTAITAVTYLIARVQAFNGFAYYDDEGYLLISLKSFLDHGSLYDDVFTQYGPFYYEFWGGAFSILGISVNHDGGRVATMAAWLLSSLLIGLSTWRMSRSIVLGLATQIVAFGALARLVVEPMHPGGIIVLLLATIVTISCFVRDRMSKFSIALLGGAVMALVLVKINVGTFALAAVALVCTATYPILVRRRWLRPLVEVGFVALPLVLMSSKAGEPWVRHYALHVTVAALALVIVLRARSTDRRNSRELWWLLGGLVVVGLVVCTAILGAGTSPSGLIEGVIKQPMRQPNGFSVPLGLSPVNFVLDVLGLLGAVGYWYAARSGRLRRSATWTPVVSALRIVVGCMMALSVILMTPAFYSVALPNPGQLGLVSFAWLALVKPPGELDRTIEFPRLLLPPLAVLQSLHAFPVAGSQVVFSALLLIPVGALCVADGVRGVALSLSGRRERVVFFAIGVIAAILLTGNLVNIELKQRYYQARAAHDGWVSIGLPGADEIRVSPDEATKYQVITAAIKANCKSFVTLPGMNSFYFWSQQEPPTDYNGTGWPTLFDDSHQERVIAGTRLIRGLCLLENVPLAQLWGNGRIPSGPLVRYLNSGFVPIATFGDYQLLKRPESGAGP